MSLANELRIGNWVEILGNSKRLDFFTTIQPSSFSVDIDKTYGPIPLDEDWLQKFGFRKWALFYEKIYSDDLSINVKFDVKDVEKLFLVSAAGTDDNWENPFDTPLRYIKNVHELQNIYSCITGSELQLNK
jgi:hypothetical protein